MNLKLEVVSIKNDEDLKSAIAKIHRETQYTYWRAWEPPYNLAGNFKVIKLTSAKSLNWICKVDGPGFLIDELYQHFLNH